MTVITLRIKMNFESPFRHILGQFEQSSAKAIVDCDINAWMQTNTKKRIANKPIVPRIIRQTKRHTINHSDRTNIALLKQKKQLLLHSTDRKQSQKIAPPTAASSNPTPGPTTTLSKHTFKIQIRSLSKASKKQPKQIEVSEFTIDEPKNQKQTAQKLRININELIRIKQVQKGPSFKLKNFTQRPPVRQPQSDKYRLNDQIIFVRSRATSSNYRGLSFIKRKMTPGNLL